MSSSNAQDRTKTVVQAAPGSAGASKVPTNPPADKCSSSGGHGDKAGRSCPPGGRGPMKPHGPRVPMGAIAGGLVIVGAAYYYYTHYYHRSNSSLSGQKLEVMNTNFAGEKGVGKFDTKYIEAKNEKPYSEPNRDVSADANAKAQDKTKK